MANNIVIPINKTVDISQGTLITTLGLQNTNDQLIQGQSYANVLNVSVTNAGLPVELSGECMGYFVRQQDGSTVTVAGTISGNVASVEFPSFVYAYTGRLTITLSVGGTDLVQIATTVRLGSTFVIVDPGNVLPNLDEIQQIMLDVESALSQLSAALKASQQATNAANAAAGAANTAAAALNGLTATANTLEPTQPATATAQLVDGAWKITMGVPQGIQGVRGITAFQGSAITGTSTTPTAYATGIASALAGDLYLYTGTDNANIGNVYTCTQGGDASTALWAYATNWRGATGAGSVSSVDSILPDSEGDVELSAVRYVSQTLTDEQQQQARANIGAQASIVQNYTYDGRDLSQMFTPAELHQKVSSGDFSGIQNGDYWPITLNGTVKDYATGETKTLSNAVFNLEANIQVYKQYGDTAVPNHILFCSRELLPWTVKMRSTDTNWYSASETNPWRGSHLFQTLNAADGVLPLVAATGIGAHMYAGTNGGGMRFLLESKATGATAANGWSWGDRGKLFLPTEREVWGQDIWSEHTYGSGAAVQWPVFASSLRHIIKGLGNGGSRSNWWCQSSCAGSETYFSRVDTSGYPYGTGAASTWLSAPLCFLFV